MWGREVPGCVSPLPAHVGRGGRADVTAPEELVFIALAGWTHPGAAGDVGRRRALGVHCVFGPGGCEKTPGESAPNPPGSARHQLPGPRVLRNVLAAASSASIAPKGQNLQAGGGYAIFTLLFKTSGLNFLL